MKIKQKKITKMVIDVYVYMFSNLLKMLGVPGNGKHRIKQKASDLTMHPTYIYILLYEGSVPMMEIQKDGDTEVNKV